MLKKSLQLDYTSGFTALCSVVFWLVSTFTGLGLRPLLPNFDGLPLFCILLVALMLACIVNRTAAKSFARSHFGMPPEERRAMLDRHTEEVKASPKAVIAKYSGLEILPISMLILYFVLVFAIGISASLCLTWPTADPLHAVAFLVGTVLTGFLGFMPIWRCFQQLRKPLNKAALVPAGSLPQLETMAKKAADAVGIKGNIRLELTRDCDCDVNVFGKTYVVFFGTRLLTSLTEDEVYQSLLSCFDYFSRLKEYRQVLRRHRLGELGAADIRPATCIFDWFYSYADATLEWEYDLYIMAYKAYIDSMSDRRIREQGNPSTAVSGMCKRAMWRFFTFEANNYLTKPFYYEPKSHDHFEWDVCEAFRTALERRHGIWRNMLEKELRPEKDRRYPLFRESIQKLTPNACITDIQASIPDLTTPYGQEVLAAVGMVDTQMRKDIGRSYAAAREREYLEPLAITEAYESNPTGYTTPELSPVINAYRDICEYGKAEALCDSIIETETNQFAQAHAIYFKGMCMLHRYETEGIDLIYRAIDLNKNYMRDGFEMVEEYCTLCGLEDEYEAFLRRADIQMSAHAYNHEGAGNLSPRDYLIKEEALGDMLPDILSYMESVADGCIREIYLVRKVISEDFFTSAFVINFEYGAPEEAMRRAYEAIFNYLDAYPVDWQFSLFVYDRATEAAVKRVEGSLVWKKK